MQEAYLRWHGADRDNVSDPRAFLMTTTTRICLDMLTLGAGAARGARRSLAAGARGRHGCARARQPHGAGRGSVDRAALDPRSAVAARARGLPAARRIRFLVQRSGHGTGAKRSRVSATCRLGTRARARAYGRGAPRRFRVRTRSMRSMRSSCPHSPRQRARAISKL